MKSVKILVLISFFAILTVFSVSAKTQQDDEKRFQLGFGGQMSTGNLLGIIESVQMYNAMTNNKDYDYPGLTDKQKQALNDLNGSMQRALLVANILGSLDYGLNMRILWNILIAEADIELLPFEGTYSGKLDFMVAPLVGIRLPWWIQPYLMAGVLFTFSFYPSEFTKIENWRGHWAATDNFCFRPGMLIRGGLDFKFKSVSFGVFAQYTVKDFQEFTNFYNELIDAGMTSAESAGRVFASQCTIGLQTDFYIF